MDWGVREKWWDTASDCHHTNEEQKEGVGLDPSFRFMSIQNPALKPWSRQAGRITRLTLWGSGGREKKKQATTTAKRVRPYFVCSLWRSALPGLCSLSLWQRWSLWHSTHDAPDRKRPYWERHERMNGTDVHHCQQRGNTLRWATLKSRH